MTSVNIQYAEVRAGGWTKNARTLSMGVNVLTLNKYIIID